MSFILDALRRAEAERERGKLPSLQAVPGPVPPHRAAAEAAQPGRLLRRPMAWALLAGALLLAAAGLIWSARSGPSPAQPGAMAGPGVVEPAQRPSGDRSPAGRAAAGGTVTPAALDPGLVPAPPGAARSQPDPMPIVDPPSPVEGAGATARRAAALPPSPVGGDPGPGAGAVAPGPATGPSASVAPAGALPSPTPPVAGTAAPAAPEPAADPAASGAVLALAELPPPLRSLVPPLTVSGSSYTEVRANRLLFLNGAMLREGDRLTPEIRLEAIELRAAVLSVRGQRFRITF